MTQTQATFNNFATIKRTVNRAREELAAAGGSFNSDQTRQDAALLNVQPALQTCVDSRVEFEKLLSEQATQRIRRIFEERNSVERVIDEPDLATLPLIIDSDLDILLTVATASARLSAD